MVPKHRWALGGWPAGLQGQHSPRRPDAGRLLPRLCVLEGGAGSHSSLRSHTGCDQGAVGVRGPRSLDRHPAVTCRPHPLSTGVRPPPPPGPSLPVSAPRPGWEVSCPSPHPPASPRNALRSVHPESGTLSARSHPTTLGPASWDPQGRGSCSKTCIGERRRDMDLSGILEQTPFTALRLSTASSLQASWGCGSIPPSPGAGRLL